MSLTSGTLVLKQHPVLLRSWQLYTQLTSRWVRFTPIFFVKGIYTTQYPKYVQEALGWAKSMGNQEIPSYSTHRDPYPSLYKGNHRDYHLSFCSQGMPFSLKAMSDRNLNWYVITGLKAFYALNSIYQASKSTHIRREGGWQKNK